MRPSIRATATAVLATTIALLTALTSGKASATTWTTSSYAARLTTLVNQARAQHGLATLTVTSGTTSVANTWTAHLVAQGGLSHNPNLLTDIEQHGSPNLRTVAENVGRGAASSPDSLFTAYMNSPEHRANILDSDMRYLGIDVDFTGAQAWNTMDFVDSYGSSAHATTTTTHHSHATTHTVRHTSTTTHHVAAKPAAKPVVKARVIHKPTTTPQLRDVANDDVQSAAAFGLSVIPQAHEGTNLKPAWYAIAAGLVLLLFVVHASSGQWTRRTTK